MFQILVTAPHRFAALCPAQRERLYNSWATVAADATQALHEPYNSSVSCSWRPAKKGNLVAKHSYFEAEAHETHGELLERLVATEVLEEASHVVVSEIDFVASSDLLRYALREDCDTVVEGGTTSLAGFVPDPTTTGPWFLAFRNFPHLPKVQPAWFRASGPRHDAANLWDSEARNYGREVQMIRALPDDGYKMFPWIAEYSGGAHLFFAAHYNRPPNDEVMPGIRVIELHGAVEDYT